MNTLRIDEHMVQDCQLWKAVITHPTPTVNDKLGMLNDDNVDDDDCWAGYHFE